MTTSPRRTARQSRPYSLMNAQRGIAVNQEPEVIERDGYQIKIRKNPFWNASVITNSEFGIVSEFGKNKEEAIEKALAKTRDFLALAA